jgi:hypothetical protein
MAQTGVTRSGGIPFTAGWKRLYQCAILEPNCTKLPQRITKARHAILDRAEEIERMKQPRNEESYLLNDALRRLQLLEDVAVRESSVILPSF